MLVAMLGGGELSARVSRPPLLHKVMRVHVQFPGHSRVVVNFAKTDSLKSFGSRVLAQAPTEALRSPALWDSHYASWIDIASQGQPSAVLDLEGSSPVPFNDDDHIEILQGAPLCAPQPLQIVEVDPATRQFVLNEDRLQSILLAREVSHLPAVVISIAGPFRGGKSFMLNFFIQYLQSTDEDDFMATPTVLADGEGFRFKHGVERETTGMWMWSRPFVRTLPSGERVAVLLVDTQGTFDNKTTTKENASIFALNSLVSSQQVYNIKEKIQEDVLQHMHLFTSYGIMVKEQAEGAKPFQALEFLIRDWEFEDYEFGATGGNQYLSTVLSTQSEDMAQELRDVREQLQSCFETLSCFLMPDPGKHVKRSTFSGNVADLDEEFIEHSRSFVARTCANDKLVVKTVSGEKVSCKNLVGYFKEYVKVFCGSELPELQSVFGVTARVNHMNVKRQALESYKDAMKKSCGPARPYVEPSALGLLHGKNCTDAREFFQNTKKLQSDTNEQEFLAELEEDMDKHFEEIKATNERKNMIHSFRTPITVGSAAFACNIFCSVLSALGLGSIAAILNIVTWVFLLCTGFWLYSNYTGMYANQAAIVDNYALVLYNLAQTYVLAFIFSSPSVTPAKKDD